MEQSNERVGSILKSLHAAPWESVGAGLHHTTSAAASGPVSLAHPEGSGMNPAAVSLFMG